MTKHIRPHPPQMARTSDMIARNLAAIQKGQNRGEFPVLDRLLTPKDNDICGEDCPIRQQARQNRIIDIYPSVPERLAVVEHVTSELKEAFVDHKEESIRASANYITRDQFTVIEKQVDAIARNSTLKTVGLVITTAVSLLAFAYYALTIGSRLHL